MSTTAQKTAWPEAFAAAEDLRSLFVDCYDRWEFAGSLRRQAAVVGDVEHVLLARSMPDPAQSTLFGESTRMISCIRQRIEKLVEQGLVKLHDYGGGRNRFGEKYIGLDHEGRMHELFIAVPENWGAILAIRTGPAEFSKAMVTRMYRYGYCMREGRLCKRRHEADESGRQRDIATPVECPDEETFFRAAGLQVIEPRNRRGAP